MGKFQIIRKGECLKSTCVSFAGPNPAPRILIFVTTMCFKHCDHLQKVFRSAPSLQPPGAKLFKDKTRIQYNAMKAITDDQLRSIIQESHSWREALLKCGYKTLTRTLKKRINDLNIDYSHYEEFFDGMHTRFNNFTKEEIEDIVKSNNNWQDIMKSLNYNSCDYVPKLKEKLQKLMIDYSHVDASLSNRRGKKLLLSEILVKDSLYTSMANLKRRLQNELGWEHICFKCKLKEWNNQPVPIQIDHINGEHTDNRIENLRFLCPNCHAQTDTYAGKNTRICKENRRLREGDYVLDEQTSPIVNVDNICQTKHPLQRIVKQKPKTPKPRAPQPPKPPKYVCCDCSKAVRKSATRCLDCYAKHKVTTRMVERPSLEQLEKDVEEMPMVKVGEKYGVSDNCIRKWIRHYHKIAETS